MRERKTVVLPVEVLDDPSLSSVEVVILAQILRFQSRIDRFTVNGMDQFLNFSKNTIRKGLLKLAASGYLTTLPGNKGWVLNEIKICASEDQNLNFGGSKSELSEIKICVSEKEEKRTKKEDKDKHNIESIYYNNNLILTRETDKQDIESETILTDSKENDKEKTKHSAGACAREEPEAPLEPDKPAEAEKPERFTQEYREIIAYLNEKTGKRYSATSRVNQGHMSARLREGFTVEDFKHVIDVKCFQWKDDPKMAKFLRPETLFGTKFDRYLNEEKVQTLRDIHGELYTVTEEELNSEIPF